MIVVAVTGLVSVLSKSLTCSLSSAITENSHTLSTMFKFDCMCRIHNYNVHDSISRQSKLQWTGEVEAGSCGALPVWLTFSCTVRLSITLLLL